MRTPGCFIGASDWKKGASALRRSRLNTVKAARSVAPSRSERLSGLGKLSMGANHAVYAPAGRIDNTGQLARATTLAVTLPSMSRSIPVRP